MNFVTPSPSPKEEIKSLPSKAASSCQSCSTVELALLAFNLATNVSSRASLRPKRSFHHHTHCKDCSLPSNLRKEILGPPKILDLPSCKKILEMTLGTCKTHSSSHLGASTCSKSKVESEKHRKHYFKTSSKTSKCIFI